MNLMIRHPFGSGVRISGIGYCKVFVLYFSDDNIGCTPRFNGIESRVFTNLDVDIKFKGLVKGEGLHEYCLECLSTVSENFNNYIKGNTSTVYE